MESSVGIVSARSISSFPLSVSTGLALETLFDSQLSPLDPTREIPKREPISRYNNLYINVATLFRNMIGALPSGSNITQVTVNELVMALQGEMEVIRSLLATEGGGVCKPVFYACTYKHAYTHVPHKAIQLRLDNTDKQKFYTKVLEGVIHKLSKAEPEMQMFDSEIKPTGFETALMISHVALDLLSHRHFNKLTLLESHTGIIKNRSKWYTKYYHADDGMSNIPFIRTLLYIFGDNTIYRPMSPKLKEEIKRIALEHRWTALTTKALVIHSLEMSMKDLYLLQMIKSF